MSDNLKLLLKWSSIFLIIFLLTVIIFIHSDLRDFLYNSSFFHDRHTKILLPICTIIILLISSWLGSLFAYKKGRNKGAWAIICFITSVWGLLALFLLPSKEIRNEKETG